jgi:hypothetical protein
MTSRHRAVIRVALAFVLLAVISHTRADPDLWGHVRFGQDMLSTRSIPLTDAYAFTSDRPWINHEWLAECLMAIAYLAGRGPGLVVLKMLVVIGMLACVWSILRRQDVDAGSRDLLVALAIVGTFPQLNHVRPQIFSVVAFAALLWILLCGGTSQRLLLIPVLFAAWVNLHGGWIVGGGVLALWALMTLASPAPRDEKRMLFVAGGLALAGTLANPYGWRMSQFLSSTVGFGRAEITDWQPVYRLGAGFAALWIAIALIAVVGVVRGRRVGDGEPRRVAVVVLLGLASFQVSRLLAFFALAVVMLAGREVAAAISAWRQTASSAKPRAASRAASLAAVLIAALLIAGGAATSAGNLTCVRMESDQGEPEIAAMVTQRRLQGRLAVWFDWGEYAIWHFAPSLQVSIDGRRETVYSDRVMQEHLNFYYVPASRAAYLSETRPDHIWLPADLPVVSSLLADGWQPLYRGLRSVWLSRDVAGLAALRPSEPEPTGRRCFPGP